MATTEWGVHDIPAATGRAWRVPAGGRVRVHDDVGRHEFLYTPCSQEMYEIQYAVTEPPLDRAATVASR